jgi:hypothetical protein
MVFTTKMAQSSQMSETGGRVRTWPIGLDHLQTSCRIFLK